MKNYRNKRIIVYGLGKEFEHQRKILENEFQIVGYSDKNVYQVNNYIVPENIKTHDFDYIYITSNKYKEEIKQYLTNLLGDSSKLISREEVFGEFRHHYESWVIEKLKQIPQGQILLDAGAGEMKYAKYCKHLKYIAQDFGEYDPNQCVYGLKLEDKWDTSRVNIKCDIIEIPLENGSVDAILCTEVFEHLKNPVLAIKEFSRLLRVGGVLILTAPFCSLTHMAPFYYSNGFSRFWYQDNLKDYGFEIKEINKDGNFFKWLCQEMFRTPEMAEKYCKDGYGLPRDEFRTLSESIKIMSRFGDNEEGSSESLCFRYMLVAKKK